MKSIISRTIAGFSLLECMIIIATFAIVAAIFAPNYAEARGRSEMSACRQNISDICAVCEMYYTENEGHYPGELLVLTEAGPCCYLKSIPTCPAIGVDTYSVGYNITRDPDVYTVRCKGGQETITNVAGNLKAYGS